MSDNDNGNGQQQIAVYPVTQTHGVRLDEAGNVTVHALPGIPEDLAPDMRQVVAGTIALRERLLREISDLTRILATIQQARRAASRLVVAPAGVALPPAPGRRG